MSKLKLSCNSLITNSNQNVKQFSVSLEVIWKTYQYHKQAKHIFKRNYWLLQSLVIA